MSGADGCCAHGSWGGGRPSRAALTAGCSCGAVYGATLSERPAVSSHLRSRLSDVDVPRAGDRGAMNEATNRATGASATPDGGAAGEARPPSKRRRDWISRALALCVWRPDRASNLALRLPVHDPVSLDFRQPSAATRAALASARPRLVRFLARPRAKQICSHSRPRTRPPPSRSPSAGRSGTPPRRITGPCRPCAR